MHKRYFKISASKVRYRQKGMMRTLNANRDQLASVMDTLQEAQTDLQNRVRQLNSQTAITPKISSFLYVPSLPGPLLSARDQFWQDSRSSSWPGISMLMVIGILNSLLFTFMEIVKSRFLFGNLIIGVGLLLFGGTQAFFEARKKSQKRIPSSARTLDNSSSQIQNLGSLYSSIYDYSKQSDNDMAKNALSGAHMALIEVCDLLGDKPPVTPEEISYVQNRVVALKKVESTLLEHKERLVLEAQSEEQKAREAESMVRKGSIEAIVAFEERTQISSLSVLDKISPQ